MNNITFNCSWEYIFASFIIHNICFSTACCRWLIPALACTPSAIMFDQVTLSARQQPSLVFRAGLMAQLKLAVWKEAARETLYKIICCFHAECMWRRMLSLSLLLRLLIWNLWNKCFVILRVFVNILDVRNAACLHWQMERNVTQLIFIIVLSSAEQEEKLLNWVAQIRNKKQKLKKNRITDC